MTIMQIGTGEPDADGSAFLSEGTGTLNGPVGSPQDENHGTAPTGTGTGTGTKDGTKATVLGSEAKRSIVDRNPETRNPEPGSAVPGSGGAATDHLTKGQRSIRALLSGIVIICALAVSAGAAYESFYVFERAAIYFGWPKSHAWTVMPLVELFLVLGSVELVLRSMSNAKTWGARAVSYTALVVTLAVNVTYRVLTLVLPVDADTGRLIQGADLIEVDWWQAVILGTFAAIVPLAQLAALHMLAGRLKAMATERARAREAAPTEAGPSLTSLVRAAAAQRLSAHLAAKATQNAQPQPPAPPVSPVQVEVETPEPTPAPRVARHRAPQAIQAPVEAAEMSERDRPAPEYFAAYKDRFQDVADALPNWRMMARTGRLKADIVQKNGKVGNRTAAMHVRKCLIAMAWDQVPAEAAQYVPASMR